MQILTELNKNPNLSLALGYFDGVHLGHQAVIGKAVEYARTNACKSAVITFRDHPCCFFWGVCPKYILTRRAREEQIAALGVDYLYELDFESISGLTANEYLKDVLINHFTPVAISTGYNHNFGCKKSGNVKLLAQEALKYGYEYFELPPQKLNNEIISSTKIRNLLAKGDLGKSNAMLGYNFNITGKVIEGNKIGRTIGFPTANLLYPGELIDLPFGVYSVDVKIYGKTFKGIANFGMRPTVRGANVSLEVHIVDFNSDIYGQEIRVNFNKMIRREKKFNSLDDLKSQICKDIMKI